MTLNVSLVQFSPTNAPWKLTDLDNNFQALVNAVQAALANLPVNNVTTTVYTTQLSDRGGIVGNATNQPATFTLGTAGAGFNTGDWFWILNADAFVTLTLQSDPSETLTWLGQHGPRQLSAAGSALCVRLALTWRIISGQGIS